MPRLSRAQQEARQHIIGLTRSGLYPEQLADKLLEALLKAVPADSGGLAGLDTATLLTNRVLAVMPDSLPLISGFYRDVYLREPAAALLPPALMRAKLQVVVLHQRLESSLGLPPSLLHAVSEVEEYRAYYGVHTRTGGSLRAAFASNGQWIAQMELARSDYVRPFGAGDLEFVRLIAPTIGRALRAAFDRERAAAIAMEEVGPDVSGVLVLADNGREQLRTPAANAWIELLQQTETGGEVYLPGAVSAAVAALRAGFDGTRHAVVRAWTPAGSLRVEATPGDDKGAVSVVLTPERPPAPPEVPAAWPVTLAERRVLELLVRGLSNRELATKLHVSVNTIQTHLAHVYEKLGIQSRGQLLSRFFHEVYWPAQHRSDQKSIVLGRKR